MNTGLYFDVAVFQLQLSLENSGVRAVADRHEQTRYVQRLNGIGIVGITQTQAAYAHLVTGHFIQRTVGVQHDVAAFDFIHQTLDQNFFGTE